MFSLSYILVVTWRVCYQWLGNPNMVSLAITKIGKWKESHPIKENKKPRPRIVPAWSPPNESKFNGRTELLWDLEKIFGVLLDFHTISLLPLQCLTSWSDCCEVSQGEQRGKIEGHCLWRKYELQDEEWFFLKPLDLLSILLHGLVFTLARFSCMQVGWSPLFFLCFCGVTFRVHCCLFLIIFTTLL